MNSLPISIRKEYLSCGFTLIELLISMVIFAVLAVMAYGGLASVIKASTGVQERIEKLESLQRTFMLFERDIRQLVQRPIITDTGDVKSALEGGLGRDALLEFTRGGNPNPVDENRSSLFRVIYKLEDGLLVRYKRSKLDLLFGAKSVYSNLLDNVEGIAIRFLDSTGKWQNEWGGGKANVLPTAVEITLKHQEWGEIRRLIPVYGY